jgi:hypothetical protein
VAAGREAGRTARLRVHANGCAIAWRSAWSAMRAEKVRIIDGISSNVTETYQSLRGVSNIGRRNHPAFR